MDMFNAPSSLVKSAIEEFIPPADIDQLSNQSSSQFLPHPIVGLLREPAHIAARETANAIRYAIRDDEQHKWLRSLATRIVGKKKQSKPVDFADAASALAELRAFGILTGAGLKPVPLPVSKGKTPDFIVEVGGQVIVVEVYSKHMDGFTQTLLDEHYNDSAYVERVDAWRAEQTAKGLPRDIHID